MDHTVAVHFAGLTPGVATTDLYDALHRPAAPTDVFGRRFTDLYHQARTFVRASTLDEAQIIIHPHRFAPGTASDQAVAAARSRGLPCLFLSWGDDATPVAVPYGVVYRHSLFRSRQLPCERAMPAIAEDSLEHVGGEVPIRHKEPRPVVGFRGYCGTLFSRALYTLAGRREKVHGLRLRTRLLSELKHSKQIDTRFEPQTHFMGRSAKPVTDARERDRQVRQAFLQNLLDADYTLCVRGGGNFSYRFYEVLSAGRVPLFVDTDCVLPFDELIDWKRHVIWVDVAEAERLGQIVADFHHALSDAAFIELQRANRTLWQQYLTPSGFWRHAIASALTGSTSTAARTSW